MAAAAGNHDHLELVSDLGSPRTGQQGKDFVTDLDAAFEVAASTVGVVEHGLEIGDEKLLLRFAGRALESAILPALEHARTAPHEAPSRVVRIWDSATTGVALPDPPWDDEDIGPTFRVTIPELTAVHQSPDRLTLRGAPDAAHWWAASPDAVPWWERGAPLRLVFLWFLTRPGRGLVHAAAIGEGRRGILISGPSGSGKSTLALACLEAGMEYAGDDFVLLDSTGDDAVAHNIYSTARADVHTLALFPDLAPSSFHQDGEKAVLAVDRSHLAQIRRQLPVDAVVIPQLRRTREPRAVSASAGEGLMSLAASSILQMPVRDGGAFSAGADLMRRVPAYRLELGIDPRAAVAPIRGILAELETR
jgi:hypothetical protein